MPLTKSQPAQALEHILTNVFDLEAKDPLRAALRDNGFVDIYDLVNMERKHVEDLAYLDEVDGTQQRIPIPWGKREIINVFRDYIIYRHEINEPIGINWTDITMEQFNKFRIDPSYLRARLLAKDGVPVFKPVTNPPAPTTPFMTNDCTPANQLFQKEIERDQSLFPILKTEQPHDSWPRKFEIQAHAQGVAHVVDNKYSPTNPDEKGVFQPIQTFVDAVLESKVHTPKGKEAIREHEATKDAPAAYANLMEHHRKSTAADIEAMKTNITTTTISDGKFKGTASEFLTNWTKQLKPYGNLTGNGSILGEDEKIVHLSRAIATVSELRQVKLTADMLRTSTKNPIDFQHHCRLVSAAAVQFDDSLTHEDDPWDPGDSFHIDTPVSHCEPKAYMSTLRRQRSQSMGSPDHRRNQRILLPTEIWHAFSDEGKLAWDTLPEADRKVILAKIKPTNNPRIVQLHQQKQGEDMEELQDASADSPVETEQCNDKLQDHKAPQLQPSIWATFLAKDKSAHFCRANMFVTTRSVIHRVSSTYVKSNQSPVDRRTNVGIACQDCKVTYVSDRTGDAQGMDNYQLSSISSSTAAGYAVSNKGPVILILNQYALMWRGHSIHSPGQLGWFKNSVCGKSIHVGGMQRIETADDYIIPIGILNGLPYVWMCKPTDKEFDTLPHIVLASDNTRDPDIIDLDHEEHEEEDNQWIDAIEGIHTTFQHTAQLVRTPTGTLLQQMYRSQNPALNVVQKGETVATYELFSGTPAVECGVTRCQWFEGMTTDVTYAHPLQTSTQFVHSLDDNAQFWGAPIKLVSDSTPIDISGRANIVPLTPLFHVTVDTSVLLWCHIWQPVGRALTWKILDAVMSKVLHQLLLRPTSEGALNIRLGTIGGEAPTYVRPTIFSKFLFSKFDDPLNDRTNCTVQMSQGILNKRDSVINDKGDTLVRLIGLIRTTKEIRVHLAVAVNHDGYYKAWLIADRHLTDDHLGSVYYCMASMRSFQIVMSLAELNVLEFWSTDIGNAHLESYPDQENHILIISRDPHGQRALYDLKLSGQGWHDGMHDCLVALVLLPCRAKPDIWMRKNGELQVWEYIVLCIGDLAFVMQHPRVPIGSLTPKLFEFKLKGIGKISDHLRIQFSQDEDRTLQLQQQKYPKKMTEGYVRFFGSKSRTNAYVPLERGDHPEKNLRSFLDEGLFYQSFISALQWIINIGWFNIFPTLITMSFIQDAPRFRHLEKISRIHSCLSFDV